MTIESKDLLVAIKAFSRGEKLPLDASEIHDSLEQAQTYAQSPTAYAGQTIKVLQNGKYETYVLNPSGDNLVLEKVGVDASAVKNYIQVVENLPEAGQEQGVIYIQGTTGSIWNGTSFQTIFTDLQPLTNRVEALETSIANVYTKAEADNKIAEEIGKISTLKRVVVDSLESVESPDENTIYMVAKVAGSGNQNYDEYMYINNKFEKIGDTEVDLTDYTKTADVDTKISTAKSEAIADAEGKIATAKTEAIAAAGTNADEKISAKLGADWPEGKTVKEFVTESTNGILTNKTITDLQTNVGALQTTVNQHTTDIANKLDASAVDEKINAKVGDIPTDTTVKSYIDTAVGSGGTASAEAIAAAKQEAINTSKTYTDTALTITEF